MSDADGMLIKQCADFIAAFDSCLVIDLRDKDKFCQAVNAGMVAGDVSNLEMSEKFCTAPGTVSRWRHGHSAPSVHSRWPIISFLIRRVKQRLYAGS